MTGKIQSSVLGSAGEYLILSHLLRLGFIAGKTPEFTKDFDLIVVNKDGSGSSPIQVKTSINTKWIMKPKHEKPIKNLFYCFVRLNNDSIKSDIFIVDSKTVAEFIKTTHRIWLKVPARNGSPHKDSEMRKFESEFKHFKYEKNLQNYLNKKEMKFIENHQDGWLDQYREAWHLLKT